MKLRYWDADLPPSAARRTFAAVRRQSFASARPRPPQIGGSHGTFHPRPDRLYLAFNKPFQVLTQFSQPDGNDKETLARFGFPANVYPIGRLDYDSEGLLLLSDDPALNNFLLDPSRRHPRTYLAQVEGVPTPEALRQLAGGVMVQGRMTLPARASLLPDPPDLPPRPVPIRFRKEIPTSWLRLTLIEGRNRQVRRMTAAVGYPTLRLVRIAIGALDLQSLGLAPGEWRALANDEMAKVFATTPEIET